MSANGSSDSAASEIDTLRAQLDAYARACANVAAEYERCKGWGLFTYPVHPDSMRAIAVAHYAAHPEARGFWRPVGDISVATA